MTTGHKQEEWALGSKEGEDDGECHNSYMYLPRVIPLLPWRQGRNAIAPRSSSRVVLDDRRD